MALALCACAEEAREPAAKTERQENAAFTTPLAFTMPGPSGCAAGYRPAEGGVCLHQAAERILGPEATKTALNAYLRGAASPRFDLGEASSRIETPSVEQVKGTKTDKWDPGALRSEEQRDAKQVEANRLHELQRQINKERARLGLPAEEIQEGQAAPPPAALEGARVEVEVDGVKKTMSAAEWVEHQRALEREALRKKRGK